MNAILRVAIAHDQLLGRLVVYFFLGLNILNLALAVFTSVPQWVIFLLFLVSFGPYLLHIKFVRDQKLVE